MIIVELGGIEPPAFRMPSERSATNPQPLMNKNLFRSVIFRQIKDR